MNPAQYRLMRRLEELELDTHLLEGLRRGVRGLSPEEADEQRKAFERLQAETLDLQSTPAGATGQEAPPADPDEPTPSTDSATVSLRARRIQDKLQSSYRQESEALARLRQDLLQSRAPQDSLPARRRA